MKKKVMLAVGILLAVILLVPVPLRCKDGGSIEYHAILYSVTDWHVREGREDSGSIEGITIEILGIEVFDNANWEDL